MTYWLIPQAVSDCRSLVIFNSLVRVSARVADITCIRQVTLKMIYTLLINKGWLFFRHLDFNIDLSTCVHRADCIWRVLCPLFYCADIDCTCYRHLSRDIQLKVALCLLLLASLLHNASFFSFFFKNFRIRVDGA